MKNTPKTSMPNKTLEDDIDDLVTRTRVCAVHDTDDEASWNDKTCITASQTTQTILNLITRECEKAMIQYQADLLIDYNDDLAHQKQKLIKELEKEAVEVLFGAQRIEAIPLSALTKFKDGK